ncbi:MAG: CDGSH iron-sulfur domain-containing protein [Patescibacteria group bacterium]|nr:CDGSH iron-sulfur domain-containing protein [Patescibacteria group bacterium]
MDQIKQVRKIKITENGPYTVSGSVPLSEEKIVNDADGFPLKWEKIKEHHCKEEYSLCRCGHSKNKPFCDKNHKEINFNGEETASNVPFEKQAETIVGPELILKDSPPLCVHARFCDRAGGIWDLVQKSDEKKSKKIAIEEAFNCPSGRLVVKDKKTGQAIEPEFEQSISATEDAEGIAGPLWVKDGIPIESAQGQTYEVRNRITLCRCGHSKNKPFCDGSHYLIS